MYITGNFLIDTATLTNSYQWENIIGKEWLGETFLFPGFLERIRNILIKINQYKITIFCMAKKLLDLKFVLMWIVLPYTGFAIVQQSSVKVTKSNHAYKTIWNTTITFLKILKSRLYYKLLFFYHSLYVTWKSKKESMANVVKIYLIN